METGEADELQGVFIVLADGREGWFYGPTLIKKEELGQNQPMIRSIDFVEPQVPQLPSAAPEEKKPDENVAKPA